MDQHYQSSQANAMMRESEFTRPDLLFLAESGGMLASLLDSGRIAAALAGQVVARFAEWSVIDYVEDETGRTHRAIIHADDAAGKLLHAVAGEPLGETLFATIDQTLFSAGSPGEPFLAVPVDPLVAAELLGIAPSALPDVLKGAPVLAVRFQVQGVSLGSMLLGWRAGESAVGESAAGEGPAGEAAAGDYDLRLLADLAGRGGAALYNAWCYRQAVRHGEKLSEQLRLHKEETEGRFDALLQSMRKIEVRVRRLFEANVIGILFSDIHGNIVGANDAFLDMIGYRREDMDAGKLRWSDITPPEHAAASQNAVDELQRLGVCTPFEKEYFRQDGTRVPVLLGAALLEGGTEHVVAFVLDLSQKKEAEQALREAQERNRAVIDNSWDCIWLLGADGTIFYASPSTKEILGYTPEEVIGHRQAEFLHPDDLEFMSESFKGLLGTSGTRITVQYRNRHRNGSWLWMEGGGTNLLGNPDVKAVVCNFRDISERKRTEEELRTRARQQAAISSFGQHALAGADVGELLEEGVKLVAEIMEVEFCKILELMPGGESLLVKSGIGWREGVVGVATVAAEKYSQAGFTLLSSEPVVVDNLNTETRFAGTQLLHDHGIISGISVIIQGAGGPYGILGAHTATRRQFSRDDVHFMQAIANVLGEALARKEAEQALHASEKHYRALIENSYDATALISSRGEILYASPSTTRVLGYSAEEFISRNIFEIMHPDDLDLCRQLFEELMADPGTSRTAQYRNLHNDGSWRWIEGTGTSFLMDSGEYGIIANYHDITERREVEIALKDAKEAAEGANRAKDQFLAVLSHELRTPLTPVLASVQALEEEPGLSGDLYPYVEIIRRNVELEARLIDDLLDLTRITKGKLQLNKDVVDTHALLQNVQEICLGDIRSKSLDLTVLLDAPDHHVYADPARLQQVFWNLMQNAVKFTPENGKVMIRSSNPVPGRLRLEVIDTGIGIEEHLLSRIFDAFEQGEQAITRRFGGLGLGLAISRMLVAAHGGALSAASDGRDQGAVFTVELDVARPDDSTGDAGGKTAAVGERPAVHILLVDDHPDTNTVMKMLLERQGYRVSTADSVGTALDLASRERFDILVSDIGLPDGTGLDIIRELRARNGMRGIALSGFGMEDDVRRSREAGFDQHLTKPISFQKLVQAIRDILS